MPMFENAKRYIQKFFNQDGYKSFIANGLYASDTLSKRESLSLYRGYTYAIISAIAEEVGRIQFYAYKTLPGGEIEEVDHPFLKVLNNPHEDWSSFEFFEMGQTLQELTGEMFIYLEPGDRTGEPKGMDLIRPDRVRIAISEETGIVTGYAVNIGPGEFMPLDKAEILHIKQPDPENFYRGLGTPEAALDYIQTEQNASKFTKNALLNNGAPAGIVSLQNQISDTDFTDIKNKWNNQYSGTKNAGKVAFVRKSDITYTKIGSSLADIAITAISQMSRDDLMAMFRTSKVILGITEDVNYSNGKNAKRVWLENVIEPKMYRLVTGLAPAMKLYKKEPDIKIGFRSPVPEDEEAKLKYYTEGLNKWLTANDIREKERLPKVPGGDVMYQPITFVPISDSGDAQASASSSKRLTVKLKKKRVIDRSIPPK